MPHGGPTMYHMEGLLCTTWRAYHALICTYRALTMHLRCTVGGVYGVHGGPGQEPAARALRARRRAGGHPVRVRGDNQRRSSASFLSSLFSLKGQILCRALSLSTPEHTSFLCFWRATVCQHPQRSTPCVGCYYCSPRLSIQCGPPTIYISLKPCWY